MRGAGADAGYPQGDQLPKVMIIDLGYGNIIPVFHPFDDRLCDLPLPLKGLVLRQAKPSPAGTDIHYTLHQRKSRDVFRRLGRLGS